MKTTIPAKRMTPTTSAGRGRRDRRSGAPTTATRAPTVRNAARARGTTSSTIPSTIRARPVSCVGPQRRETPGGRGHLRALAATPVTTRRAGAGDHRAAPLGRGGKTSRDTPTSPGATAPRRACRHGARRSRAAPIRWPTRGTCPPLRAPKITPPAGPIPPRHGASRPARNTRRRSPASVAPPARAPVATVAARLCGAATPAGSAASSSRSASAWRRC